MWEKLLKSLLNLFSGLSKSKLPELGQLRGVPFTTIQDELQELAIANMMGESYRADRMVFSASEEGWQKLVPLLTFSGEYYVLNPEAPDCDDYTKKAQAEAAFQFHVQVLDAWGYRPNPDTGEPWKHSFPMVRIGKKQYRIFEPNAGFIETGQLFKIGEFGYTVDSWRL